MSKFGLYTKIVARAGLSFTASVRAGGPRALHHVCDPDAEGAVA